MKDPASIGERGKAGVKGHVISVKRPEGPANNTDLIYSPIPTNVTAFTATTITNCSRVRRPQLMSVRADALKYARKDASSHTQLRPLDRTPCWTAKEQRHWPLGELDSFEHCRLVEAHGGAAGDFEDDAADRHILLTGLRIGIYA